MEIFKSHIEMIKKMKDVAVILMGDMVNVGLKDSVGAGPYDDSRNPEEQYEEMLGFLLPISTIASFSLILFPSNNPVRYADGVLFVPG